MRGLGVALQRQDGKSREWGRAYSKGVSPRTTRHELKLLVENASEARGCGAEQGVPSRPRQLRDLRAEN